MMVLNILIICKICQRDTEDLTSITHPENTEELEDYQENHSIGSPPPGSFWFPSMLS